MLPFFVIAPMLIATFLFVASTNDTARKLAIVFQLALFIASAYLVLITRDAYVITYIGEYSGYLGIVLRANNLSADFVLITTFIFLAISVYSYSEKRDMPLFWFLLFLMEASLIGLFLSGDLFNIFVLVEVSSTVTLLLVMYDRQKRNMYHGMVFLMTNIVAAQLYLFGLGYIYAILGTLDIYNVAGAIAQIEPEALVLPYALIMTSIAFKCTLVPFFSWSPKVRVYPGAPTVVQAILSGLQIKSALYLFLRLQDVFQPMQAHEVFLVIGIISGVFGAFMAICQTNIKMILAYHTISQVGLIIVGVSSQGLYSYVGGLYHIFSHAVFKTALFLCAGIIIHSYGTSDIYKIRGVMKRMPVIGIATLFAVLGIMGAPFFIGSVSKYFIAYGVPLPVEISIYVISLGTIISFIKFSSIFKDCSQTASPPFPILAKNRHFHSALKGLGTDSKNTEPELIGDVPRPETAKSLSSAALGIICLAGGVFGTGIIQFLFGHEVHVAMASYIQKSIIFLFSVGIGYLVYNYVVKNNKTLKFIGGISLSFRSICISLGVFFAVLMVYTGFLG